MKPQTEKLLEALRKGPLTTKQIRDRLGIGMPATRIFELRQAGYTIASKRVEVKNRGGQTCQVAQYRLIDEQEKQAAA